MERWQTNRGDEWWYSAAWGRATASAAAGQIRIDSVEALNGRLTAAQLQRLLSGVVEEFPGFSVLCTLDAVTRPIIEELASAQLLRWELLQNPYSRDARILEIATCAARDGGDGSPRRAPSER